jgi:hypothetical protein
MSKELKVLLITIGVSLGLLWILKPKKELKSKETKNKYAEPKEADKKKLDEKENAVVGIQAMREAINSGEKKAELDKLSSIILKENGIKVLISKKNGLLKAMNKKGDVIAEEEMNK